MHRFLKIFHNTRGFVALTGSVVIFTTLFAFSLLAFWVVWNKYDEQILLLERIQAKYNIESCLIFAKNMVYKDYYINGKITLKPFGCDLIFQNNYDQIQIYATSTFDRVKKSGGLKIDLSGL